MEAPPTVRTQMSTTTRMHVALNVSDLERSVAFYRTLFGVEPSKLFPDYARFTLADPPLVFSLNPGRPGQAPGRLSHLGFQVASAAELERARERLAAAGVATRDEREATCCYAVQNKVWASDPDGNAWELYEVLADAETHSGAPATGAPCCAGA